MHYHIEDKAPTYTRCWSDNSTPSLLVCIWESGMEGFEFDGAIEFFFCIKAWDRFKDSSVSSLSLLAFLIGIQAPFTKLGSRVCFVYLAEDLEYIIQQNQTKGSILRSRGNLFFYTNARPWMFKGSRPLLNSFICWLSLPTWLIWFNTRFHPTTRSILSTYHL